MAGAIDSATPTILKTLAILVPLFYVIYFSAAACLAAGFGLLFDARLPFAFVVFDPTQSGYYLLNFLSMIITYILSTLLLYFVARSTRMCFDYAFTLTFIHWILSMMGKLRFICIDL